jgi:hypothetical protein
LLYFQNILYITDREYIHVIEIQDNLNNEEVVKVDISTCPKSVVCPELTIHTLFPHEEVDR